MDNNDHYRQGDLLIKKAEDTEPKSWEPRRRRRASGILLRGEATGHAHRIRKEDLSKVDVLIDTAGNLWIRAKEPTQIIHEEHGSIDIAPGFYEVRRQREFRPGGDRLVRD